MVYNREFVVELLEVKIVTLLNILQFPDPRLKLTAEPVTNINDDTRKIVEDMFETMYEAQGVGLAAIQVNVQQRIITIDISENKSNKMCLINPTITKKEGQIAWEEGCLSFPGVYAKVKRAEKIEVEYLDENGDKHELKTDGLLAVCIQHEIDHLDGITFYDHLSKIKQSMLNKKLQKLRDKQL